METLSKSIIPRGGADEKCKVAQLNSEMLAFIDVQFSTSN